MDKKIATKWVKALRSGDYTQGTGTLRSEKGFCCLGVLCNLHAEAHPETAAVQDDAGAYMGETAGLPNDVKHWAGMKNYLGTFPGRVKFDYNGRAFYSLTEANDGGTTFVQIADYIENNYEKL